MVFQGLVEGPPELAAGQPQRPGQPVRRRARRQSIIRTWETGPFDGHEDFRPQSLLFATSLHQPGPVLTEVAAGVFVRQSAFCLSNAIAVRDEKGLLLIDPGVTGDDLEELADDLDALGLPVVAGFATHPHWDHVLWHARFGDVPRYGTATCAAVAAARLDRMRTLTAAQAPGAAQDLLGRITALPPGATTVRWAGASAPIVEHQAHAPGHAALVIEDAGVLVAADMLSDVEIPLLDPEAHDPIGDYLTGLDLLAHAARDVTVLIPGHGHVARGTEIGARIDADRSYVRAIARERDPKDPRVAPSATYGRDWLPETHERQLRLGRESSE
jgi:glyoxylase-like metal-dependent hydrolase (beta-lactamase superfamily II)